MNKGVEGLTRYIESASIDNHLIKKAEEGVIREALKTIPSKLRESINTDDSKGWWVPISHYGDYVNGNGRIYNAQLWKNVLNNQKDVWMGSPMLVDHPSGDSDGNPRDICGVWLDAKFGECDRYGIGIVFGLLVPSGRNGQDLQDHLQNGLRIGTSSSGFGKLLRDGKTVDPDTFQIERLADWVLNPSQGTFFSYDEDDNSVRDSSITESNEADFSSVVEQIQDEIDSVDPSEVPGDTAYNKVCYIIENSFDFNNEQIASLEKYFKDALEEKKTINSNNYIKEKVVKDSKLTKLEEKKFRRDMESFLESASNIKDPQERLEEFKEIREYLEDGACPDLKEKVEAKIAEEESLIKKALQEHIEMKEELGIESSKDLKEKLSKIVEDSSILSQEAKDWKQISEQLQTKYSEIKESLEKRPTEEFVEFQREKIQGLSKELESQNEKAAAIIKQLTEAYKKVKEECENCKSEKAKLEADNASLEKSLEESKSACSQSEELLESLKKESAEKEVVFSEASSRIQKMTAVIQQQKKSLDAKSKEVNSLNESLKKKSASLKEVTEELLESSARERKLFNEKKVSMEKRTESSVDAYYNSLCESFGPEMRQYEDELKNCKTLNEAKQYFYKYIMLNLQESREVEAARIPENYYTSPSERSRAMGIKQQKTSVVDRKPEGWL